MASCNWTFSVTDSCFQDDSKFRDSGCSYCVLGRRFVAGKTPQHPTKMVLAGYVQFKAPRSLAACKAIHPAAAWVMSFEPADLASAACKVSPSHSFAEWGTICARGNQSQFEHLHSDIRRGTRNKRVLEDQHGTFAPRNARVVRRMLDVYRPRPATPAISIRPWQANLLGVLSTAPDPRKVYFVVDRRGGRGKTTFCTLVRAKLDRVQVMRPWAYSDMVAQLDERTEVLLLDCPRSRSASVPYDFLEAVKDGLVESPRYEFFSKELAPCHVVVLMHAPPDTTQLSPDRCVVIAI